MEGGIREPRTAVCPKEAYCGAEEVYDQYQDTAGNLHWTGTISGKHIIPLRSACEYTQGSNMEGEE